MIRNLIKVWHETLFSINGEDKEKIFSDLDVNFKPITMDNINLVKNLRGNEYVKQFREHIFRGDFGYYAYIGDKPLAYGWIKHSGSKDYFFKINTGCCYLCRFFTHETARGHNVYPLLISELMEHEKLCKKFFIDIERGNVSSEKGLKKVGFKQIKELKFLRVFKITINKYTLKNDFS